MDQHQQNIMRLFFLEGFVKGTESARVSFHRLLVDVATEDERHAFGKFIDDVCAAIEVKNRPEIERLKAATRQR